MLDDNGGAIQKAMEQNPSIPGAIGNMFFLLRGIVLENGVSYQDAPLIEARQTLVNLRISDLQANLWHVPVLALKINRDNGEYIDPEPGDLVAVGFFGGNLRDPVVVGFLPPPSNNLQSKGDEAPQYHRRQNGTDLKIEKDGTERKYIKKDKVTVIEGQEQLTVNTGDITINVVQGGCTVTIKGKTAWRSDGTIELDGTAGTGVKGVVQGDCLCAFTGKAHPHISASVKGSK